MAYCLVQNLQVLPATYGYGAYVCLKSKEILVWGQISGIQFLFFRLMLGISCWKENTSKFEIIWLELNVCGGVWLALKLSEIHLAGYSLSVRLLEMVSVS